MGLWTRQIVTDLLLDRFNIQLSVTAVGNQLHRIGLTPQELLRRAYERNDEDIKEWKEEGYPEIKKALKQRVQKFFG